MMCLRDLTRFKLLSIVSSNVDSRPLRYLLWPPVHEVDIDQSANQVCNPAPCMCNLNRTSAFTFRQRKSSASTRSSNNIIFQSSKNMEAIKSIIECLTGYSRKSSNLTTRYTRLSIELPPYENDPAEEELAARILRTLVTSEKSGENLTFQLQSLVSTASWTESLARRIL